LGDMINNKQLVLLPAKLQEGVLLHRKIDTFTDIHPDIKRSLALLRPTQGKYAPVVVDVLYDYLLFKNWDRLTDSDFRDFTAQFYDRLLSLNHHFPDYVKIRSEAMVQGDFLKSYTHEAGMRQVFLRLESRAKFPNQMRRGFDDLNDNWELHNEAFLAFFPKLNQFVQEQMRT
jgi:acyl carrier protein phosphodiesterase